MGSNVRRKVWAAPCLLQLSSVSRHPGDQHSALGLSVLFPSFYIRLTSNFNVSHLQAHKRPPSPFLLPSATTSGSLETDVSNWNAEVLSDSPHADLCCLRLSSGFALCPSLHWYSLCAALASWAGSFLSSFSPVLFFPLFLAFKVSDLEVCANFLILSLD